METQEFFKPVIIEPNKLGLVYKELYETPLAALNRFKINFPELNKIKLAYAGRLDPMAEGLLLVLIGDECKKRDQYQKLDKTYQFDILFGLSTDSDDSLGKIIEYEPRKLEDWYELLSKISEDYLNEFIGELNLKPPLMSAVRVDAKPLFELYRTGIVKSLKDVSEIKMKVKSLRKIFKTRFESEEYVLNQMSERISRIIGDFRQTEILNSIEILDSMKERQFALISFVADVESGTYIRSIAREFGKRIGVPSIAWKIKRMKVGEWDLKSLV